MEAADTPKRFEFQAKYSNLQYLPADTKVAARKLRFEFPFVVMVADGFSLAANELGFEITGEPYSVESSLGLLRIWFCKQRAQTPSWFPVDD